MKSMDSKKLLTRSALLIFFILFVNTLALVFHWYSSVWYFDMIMHFLGGAWLGLFFVYFFSQGELQINQIIKIFLAVLFVGAGWEIFEVLVNNFTNQDPFNFLDTVSDIFFDLAGGMSMILYGIFKKS